MSEASAGTSAPAFARPPGALRGAGFGNRDPRRLAPRALWEPPGLEKAAKAQAAQTRIYSPATAEGPGRSGLAPGPPALGPRAGEARPGSRPLPLPSPASPPCPPVPRGGSLRSRDAPRAAQARPRWGREAAFSSGFTPGGSRAAWEASASVPLDDPPASPALSHTTRCKGQAVSFLRSAAHKLPVSPAPTISTRAMARGLRGAAGRPAACGGAAEAEAGLRVPGAVPPPACRGGEAAPGAGNAWERDCESAGTEVPVFTASSPRPFPATPLLSLIFARPTPARPVTFAGHLKGAVSRGWT